MMMFDRTQDLKKGKHNSLLKCGTHGYSFPYAPAVTPSTRSHHRSQTPQLSPCALPCLGLQVMRQGDAALQAQQNLKKRKAKIIFLCEANFLQEGEGCPR